MISTDEKTAKIVVNNKEEIVSVDRLKPAHLANQEPEQQPPVPDTPSQTASNDNSAPNDPSANENNGRQLTHE